MSVHSAQLKNNTWTLSHNASRLALSREWGGGNDVMNFDHAGRPWNLYLEDVSYHRGLDNRAVARWNNAHQVRLRRRLPEQECQELVRLAHQTAKEFLDLATVQPGAFEPRLSPEALESLKRAARFDLNLAMQEAETFHRIYLPVGVLPPDQSMALLVQGTEGSSISRSIFRPFYPTPPFRIKSLDEFRQHAQAIHNFLGPGVSSRRTVFLGDADALAAPTDHLLVQISCLHEIFDLSTLGGIHAMLDGFSGLNKSRQEYRTLAAHGLARACLALESGHDPLLRALNKPADTQDAIETVHRIKSAGISIGVLLLLGAGGRSFAGGHVLDSIHAIRAMGLDLHDQVYVCDLADLGESPYARTAGSADFEPLTQAQLDHQWDQLQEGLQFSEPWETPQMTRYDLREFIY